MEIILIGGKAQHGKDTTATIMKNTLEAEGKTVLITHFGDTVKFVCKNYFNWNGLKDENGRHLLQMVGTDMVRSKFPTFWTDFVKDLMMAFDGSWDYVIIPDCRFKNELYTFKNDDHFKTDYVRIIRPNFESTLTEEQKRHPSEIDLDDVEADWTIVNNESLHDYHETVKAFVKQVILGK